MSSSESPTSKTPSFSGLTAVIGEAAPHLTTFTIVLLLLLYGYEIFNFSLSIDEEAFAHASLRATVAQGRWAVGLIGYLLPWLGNIPVISTVLFCLGLGVSARLLAPLLFRKHSAQWAFVGILLSFPVWPHMVEFNALSWNVGLGSFLLTIALLFSLSGKRTGYVWAAALLAVATGIYQSFYLCFLVLLCIQHLSVLVGEAPASVPAEPGNLRWIAKCTLIALGGLVAYVGIEKIFLAILTEKIAYIQQFVAVQDWTNIPAVTFARTLQRSRNMLIGGDAIYLGYGQILTLLPLLGLLMLVGHLLVGKRPLSQRLFGVLVLVGAIGFGLEPIIMSGGTIPARALMSWIPLTAFLAGFALSSSGRFEKLLCAVLAVTLLFSTWVTVSLFYSDHVARQRDELLAARIMARVDRVVPNPMARRIPFVIVGPVPSESWESFQKVEIFGTSFFEHVGGDPFRIASYLHLLGVDNLEPHGLNEYAALRPQIDDMPTWPAADSVGMVSGVLVIKLGPLPYFERPKPKVAGTKLIPVQVTASNSLLTNEPAHAVDGDINTPWAAGGPQPQWIQFDLGKPTDISALLLDPAQSPEGSTIHEIHGGPTPDSLKLLTVAEQITQDNRWIEVQVAAKDVRYIKVVTIKSPSWISWREVEIYK